MQTGWVKLPRDFLDFEYYKDAQTKGIYLHLLLTAEYSPRRLGSVELAAGQTLTTVKELVEKTGATKSQTRTALTRLQHANKIAIKTTNKFTIITLINTGFQNDNDLKDSKQNGKEFEKEIANKSQTKLTELSKPTLLYKNKELRNKEIETRARATADADPDDYILTDEEVEECDFLGKWRKRYKDIFGHDPDLAAMVEHGTLVERFGYDKIFAAYEIAEKRNIRNMDYVRKILLSGGE